MSLSWERGSLQDLYEAVAIVLSEIQKHDDGSPD